MKENLKIKVSEIITSLGYHFVDLKFTGKKQEPCVEILVDSDTGITIDECTEISRKLSETIDELDYSDFRFNVSSPGIGYPLEHDWQLKKTIGKKIEIKSKADNRIVKIIGLLINFDINNIYIENLKDEKIIIERKNIQTIKEII
jgi:ribosome maturation factor RimP